MAKRQRRDAPVGFSMILHGSALVPPQSSNCPMCLLHCLLKTFQCAGTFWILIQSFPESRLGQVESPVLKGYLAKHWQHWTWIRWRF
jgi:hypothetical protein